MSKPTSHLRKATLGGLLVALGIVYGDIGTSPLYTFAAIVRGQPIQELLVVGGASLIIWTLTMQTTIKYVVLTLRADNKGEGGIFSLYALIRRHAKWAVIFAMIGGAGLLADGLITPPISVTSAIEGLGLPQGDTVKIVLFIITSLFVIQQFGTEWIGRFFGPIMCIWFLMMALVGLPHLLKDPSVLRAFNPYYGLKLLYVYPKGFLILGAVFLCTTGAEALYSDLGHCGRANIRFSWIYVKTCLILSYLGQSAWLLSHKGEIISENISPFYAIMPGWFLPFGIVIATAATIIASQALISGSYTLVSEAMRLNLWPKLKINYPTEEKGQLYVPGINLLLFIGCVSAVLLFQRSSAMEAAYGITITVCMLMTSFLFAVYLYAHRVKPIWIGLYLVVYLTIEFSFLFSNLVKFVHGGYFSIFVGGLLFLVMYVWYKSRKIRNRYVEFVRLEDYLPLLQELSNDQSIPKYATHLVYLTSANHPREIEHKIIYSIFNKKPKRADIYWFVHVDVLDDPYTCEYVVDTIIPNEVIRIEFRLGFRVEQRINLMFRKVVEDMVQNREVNITSRYESLSKNNVVGDFRFIVIEKFLSHENDLPIYERLMMRGYFLLKKISLSEERGFGLDPSYVTVEKFPLVIAPVTNLNLKRVYEQEKTT
ncbi:MAG: KUP/HAK/KT family potassium transporter [Thermoflavifilum sp.]|uniref:KUP/HAK/KT family potassium transporter n=1 Tax=Thermoflavifilum sp. TaxID=1968839 RepID=UPI0018A6751A|nr:KUP/HAK/KT family potassium transporter [Thermoflavifilum sp.]QOR75174.1 MAG: KUP/HAK/KT family potassium transporter [Thermoflavifilum sp.]